jgi:hypothetical protein
MKATEPALSDQELPKSQPVRYGLVGVHVALQLQTAHGGGTAVARSGIHENGARGINIWLSQDHLLTNRALSRADSLLIRFLVALALVEFCSFWSGTRDGAATRRALKRLAGIPPHEEAWVSGFASRLAASEAMRVVDNLPIFAKMPQTGPFDLFVLPIEARSPSDIRNWQVRDGATEAMRPIPAAIKVKPPPMAELPVPDPFLSAFHDRAKQLLGTDDYNMIVEMTKEEVARGS